MILKPPVGSRRKRKRVGRGTGSGHGCTSGRGNKGQKSRSGFSLKRGFEGGQMPLVRRIPKRGFNNKKFADEYQIVNISDLNRFEDGQKVDFEALHRAGLVSKKIKKIKLLGNGELKRKLEVIVNSASKKAKEAIEKAGGSTTIQSK